jgi:hypothetical protein
LGVTQVIHRVEFPFLFLMRMIARGLSNVLFLPYDFYLIDVIVMSVMIMMSLLAVFLLARTVEYRKNGYSDTDSILFGLAQSGGIITAAGCIMVSRVSRIN